MKWIFLLLVFSSHLCRSQYIQNKNKDNHFYELMQHKNKKIAYLFYNKYAQNEDGIYFKFISNRGNINYLSNSVDSLKILNYIESKDTTLFDAIKLMELVRENKMVAYDYANPNIQYHKDSINRIMKLYSTICYDFEKEQNLDFNIYFSDSTKPVSSCSYDLTLLLKDIQFYEVFLEIKKRRNKIKSIKTKGIIIYEPFKNPINNDVLGLVGFCCFVFK